MLNVYVFTYSTVHNIKLQILQIFCSFPPGFDKRAHGFASLKSCDRDFILSVQSLVNKNA